MGTVGRAALRLPPPTARSARAACAGPANRRGTCPPTHTDRLRRTAPRFGATVFWDIAGDCAGHPSPVTDPPRVPRVSPRSGILLANNLHDPATPLTNALAVLRRLPATTRVLLADADGHGAAYTSPCASEAFAHYLNDPAGQPPYTMCSTSG
ncbi:alpha/beta hydrolase [Streptomyces sp. NPDC021100]|uniref:alpha/beta hydrolase n=1 Tax=Streptomyces sp. NPDC021100 TaxID=3365114 RepID=UPI00378BA6C1